MRGRLRYTSESNVFCVKSFCLYQDKGLCIVHCWLVLLKQENSFLHTPRITLVDPSKGCCRTKLGFSSFGDKRILDKSLSDPSKGGYRIESWSRSLCLSSLMDHGH